MITKMNLLCVQICMAIPMLREPSKSDQYALHCLIFKKWNSYTAKIALKEANLMVSYKDIVLPLLVIFLILFMKAGETGLCVQEKKSLLDSSVIINKVISYLSWVLMNWYF